MSAPLIGHGGIFTLVGPTGGTAINQAVVLESVAFGSNKVDTHDITDMGTAASIRKFIAGLENAGDMTIKYFVKPGDAGQKALETAKTSGAQQDFTFSYPGGVRIIGFSGIITSIDEDIPNDKPAMVTAKIQLVTDKTYTPSGN